MSDRKNYYEILEQTQKGNLDITKWLEWFLTCIHKAIKTSYDDAEGVLKKYMYLNSIKTLPLNERQTMMITKLLDPSWFGVLNSSKWAKITKCSTDTALRDISDLIEKGILQKDLTSGGRITNYKIIW
jgi:Fic family protein